MVKIAIIQYSTYGHVTILAKAIQKGIQQEGGDADIFQIPETLSDEVLTLIHAPPKPADIPVATIQTLEDYDAFLFGLPTRYGNVPSQFSSFWDATGAQWASGAFYGKPYGLFVSTGTPGGGQEITLRNILSSFTHHGMVFVPLGYANVFGDITNLDEVHGGSPWGAGVLAAGDGSRQPSELELRIATTQGSSFYNTVKRFGSSATDTDKITDTATPPVKEAAAKTTSASATAGEARKAQTETAAAATEKSSEGSKCCAIM